MKTITSDQFEGAANDYLTSLNSSFSKAVLNNIYLLATELRKAWENGNKVYICGNGGSAANAIHIANDLFYGIGACDNKSRVKGLNVEALSTNQSILTCLANDTGYENIYSKQIEVKGNENDILIVLSGSGKSENIIRALKQANKKSMTTVSITAFTGGECINLSDITIHFEINNMQIAEDTQLIVGHICMSWLMRNKPTHAI